MKSPWVSRALYEASEKRCSDLENERRLLLNRLAEKAGFRMLFAEGGEELSVISSQLSVPAVPADPTPVRAASASERVRPTIDDVEAWTNARLRRQAEETGRLRAN